MLKQLALIAGGIYIASKLSKSQEEYSEGVVPSVVYDDVRSMEPVDFQIVFDRLVDMTSSILDPVRRHDMIEQIKLWIDSGLDELEIRERIASGLSVMDQMLDDVVSVKPLPVSSMPINTIEELNYSAVPLTAEEITNLVLHRNEDGVPIPVGIQAYRDIKSAMVYGFDPYGRRKL